MLYLAVRLSALQQLQKVASDLYETCVTEVGGALSERADLIMHDATSWYWLSGTTPLQIEAVCKSIDSIRQLLESKSRKLQGFSVALLHLSDISEDSAVRILDSFLLRAPPEDAVWTDAPTDEFLGSIIRCDSSHREYRRVLRFNYSNEN